MKTRIFVCSNSGIDYVPHSLNVKSIPAIIHFSEEEQYEDYLDVSIDAFYSRMRYDSNAKIKIVFQNYVKLCEYVEEAKNEGYQQILFILGSKEFSDLLIPIQIAISENKDIPCYLYHTNSISYPLAYMTNEADNMLIGGATILEVFERLDFIKDNYKLFFFIPDCKDEGSNAFKKKFEQGKLYTLEDGVLQLVKNSKTSAYNKMIKEIIDGSDNEDAVIFSLYTDKTTVYLNLFDKSIADITGEHKKIKSYPINPGIGITLGSNAVGMGFIIKK